MFFNRRQSEEYKQVTVISGSSDSFSVVITVTEEPLLINPFISDVIRSIHADIKKIYIVQGSVIGKKKFGDKIQYIITICLISGLFSLVRRSFIVLSYGFLKHMVSDASQNPFSVAYTAKKYRIPVTLVHDINSASFLTELKNDKPTIIINQAQAILKEQFLTIPRVGSLNRHCGLLPKYRGRLAPFWALLKGEEESGVSIHFIDKEIDNGPILVQKKVPITRSDTFDSLLAKDFAIAPEAMVEAVGLIKSGEYNGRLIPNEKQFSSYYSSPTIQDALSYRKKLLKRWWDRE